MGINLAAAYHLAGADFPTVTTTPAAHSPAPHTAATNAALTNLPSTNPPVMHPSSIHGPAQEASAADPQATQAPTFGATPDRAPQPQSPREWFNAGTRHLEREQFGEAEVALQKAVATSRHESVQTVALFNLGHARFRQGVEALKDAPPPRATQARAEAGQNAADQAIRTGRDALADEVLDHLLAAYQRGRGARKELKAAQEAVRRALDTHGAVLLRWQRAAGDFHSAHELDARDADAAFNAQVVERHIAGLVDQMQMLQMMAQCLGDKRQELQQLLEELKSKIPKGKLPDDLEGDDEEEEDHPRPQPGKQELATPNGREMKMSWEEAMRLLQALKLDENRKLPMGATRTEKPRTRSGKDW